MVTPADYEDEEIEFWDWRDYPGVIGPVIDQQCQATCWAVAVVRAVQALLNIGICIQQQLELSTQHIVNTVKFDPDGGISNIKSALAFMKVSGVCTESQCRRQGELVKRKCFHKQVNCHTIDNFTHLSDIEDIDLKEMVRRQPIIALIPDNDELQDYNIDKNWLLRHDRTQDTPFSRMHVVLIVGYGIRYGKHYWIIQNSWRNAWGDGGFGYVYRQVVRGRSLSQFAQVFVPNKRDYPKDQV